MKTTIIALALFAAINAVNTRGEIANVGSLTIDIPAGFEQEAKHEKDSLGDLEVNRWRARDNLVFEILYYAGLPKQDCGPMVVAAEEDIEVAGQKTKLIETKVFYGRSRRALVVHLRVSEAIYIFVSEQMSKEDFKGLLSSARFAKKESDSR